MKKLVVFTLFALFLAGCGEEGGAPANGDANEEPVTEARIEKPDYSLQLPSSWRELALNELPDRILTHSPQAVFQAKNADAGVYANITITTDTIPNSLSALEFSRQTIQNEAVTLIGYQKFSESDVKVSGQDTKLIEFEAMPDADSKSLHFWQTFLTRENKGLVFTAAIAPQASTETRETVLKILNSIVIN